MNKADVNALHEVIGIIKCKATSYRMLERPVVTRELLGVVRELQDFLESRKKAK